jgi:hypothetical protein
MTEQEVDLSAVVGEVDPLLHVAAYFAQGRDELRPLKACRDDSGQRGPSTETLGDCTYNVKYRSL